MFRLIHCCKQSSVLSRIPALSFCDDPSIYSRNAKHIFQHSFVLHKSIATNHSYCNYSNKNEHNSKANEPKRVRQLPQFSDALIKPPRVRFLPLIYWYFANTLDGIKIRNLCDPDYTKNDFREGSGKAIEVNTIFVDWLLSWTKFKKKCSF